MKAMKTICTVALSSCALQAMADSVLFEDFEDSAVGYALSAPEASDGSYDYFGRVAADGISIGSGVVFDNYQGIGFFAAQDMDANGAGDPNIAGANASLTWAGLDIAGFDGFEFSVFLAEDDDGTNNDWDSVDDYLRVEYRIDGGGWVSLLAFENNGDTYNSAPFEDTDFDGIGDGAELTSTFARFSKQIEGAGSSMDLRITMDLDSGDEDIAIDNVSLQSIPEPATLSLLGIFGTSLLVARRRLGR